MKRLEIDLPMATKEENPKGRTKYEPLEVICRVTPNYDPKVAGERLYQVLEHMPVNTIVELFRNPDFMLLYASFLQTRRGSE